MGTFNVGTVQLLDPLVDRVDNELSEIYKHLCEGFHLCGLKAAMSSQDCAFGVLVIMMIAVRSIDYDYGQARYHMVNYTFECHVKEV